MLSTSFDHLTLLMRTITTMVLFPVNLGINENIIPVHDEHLAVVT